MWMVYQIKVTVEANLTTLSPLSVYGWCTKTKPSKCRVTREHPSQLPPYPEIGPQSASKFCRRSQCPPITLTFSLSQFHAFLLHLNPLTKLPHFLKLLHIAFAVQSVISNANHLLRPVLRRDLKQYAHQTALANSK